MVFALRIVHRNSTDVAAAGIGTDATGGASLLAITFVSCFSTETSFVCGISSMMMGKVSCSCISSAVISATILFSRAVIERLSSILSAEIKENNCMIKKPLSRHISKIRNVGNVRTLFVGLMEFSACANAVFSVTTFLKSTSNSLA